MSFSKIAFVQGLQRSLISSNALAPYSSPLQAKIAAELAADKIDKDPAEGKPSEDSVTDAMTELVDEVPAEEVVEAIEGIAQSGELEEALADLEQAANQMDGSEVAADAVENLKQAAIARRFLRKLAEGQITSDATSLMSAPEQQHDSRGEGFAHGNPVKKVKGTVAPGTSKVVALNTEKGARNTPSFVGDGGADINAKQAAWLLRKLAEGEDASAIGGKGQSPDQDDGRPTAYANNAGEAILQVVDAKAGHGLNQAVAHPGSENGTVRVDKANGPVTLESDQVRLAHLIQKTAQEVGHFLPSNLTDTDKVAALRTMVGMNNQERAAYLGRIKSAMDAAQVTENEEDIDKLEKDVEDLQNEAKEKEAALMLRRLGIGA